jgi:hypothetical protein
MMRVTLLAALWLPLGALFLWPLLDRWLADDGARDPLRVALTALALSPGALAAGLFWLGLPPGERITAGSSLAIALSGLALGLALNPGWIAPTRWRAWWRRQWARLARLDVESLLTLAVIGALAVILIHALYYPFLGDDVYVRYGLHAKRIMAAHRLPLDVAGYPPLVPLNFAAIWLVSGGVNEHIARAFIALTATGTLCATYLIGRRVAGRSAGLIAAALVALTPLFVDNATLAYTDIPTAFPLTLAMLYILRWWDAGRARDALTAGLLVAVGCLTKQSALIWPAALAAVPILWLIATRREAVDGRWRLTLPALAALLAPPLLLAGPWYLRNALLDGWYNAVPVAGLYHQLGSGAGLWGLVPPLAYPSDFGWPLTPVYALGWVIGLIAAARELIATLRARQAYDQDNALFIRPPTTLILALAAVPYWGAWWLRFSFEARFLLLILPLIALWAAPLILRASVWLAERARVPRVVQTSFTGLLLAVLLLLGARGRLGGVYYALTDPFASDFARLSRAKGPLADLAAYARSELDPATDRLYLMDERLVYFLPEFDTAVGYPQTLAALDGYDYLFHVAAIYALYGNGRLGWEDSEFYHYAFDERVFEPVYESGGVHVMRILRTTPPPEDP